jgi:hypothetical protein
VRDIEIYDGGENVFRNDITEDEKYGFVKYVSHESSVMDLFKMCVDHRVRISKGVSSREEAAKIERRKLAYYINSNISDNSRIKWFNKVLELDGGTMPFPTVHPPLFERIPVGTLNFGGTRPRRDRWKPWNYVFDGCCDDDGERIDRWKPWLRNRLYLETFRNWG